VFSRARGGCLGGQLIELDGGHAGVNSLHDLLGDDGGVYMHRVEVVAQLIDARGNLVEMDNFFSAISLNNEHNFK